MWLKNDEVKRLWLPNHKLKAHTKCWMATSIALQCQSLVSVRQCLQSSLNARVAVRVRDFHNFFSLLRPSGYEVRCSLKCLWTWVFPACTFPLLAGHTWVVWGCGCRLFRRRGVPSEVEPSEESTRGVKTLSRTS